MRLAGTAPFGQTWPGLAAGSERATNPDQLAAEYAQVFLAERVQTRLGLVAAASGAEALAVAGWDGPCNYDNGTAKFSAVVPDWEQRFGARVVAVGFSTLHLSIAAPPVDEHEALLLAAEHFAFCPDNIWQGKQAVHTGRLCRAAHQCPPLGLLVGLIRYAEDVRPGSGHQSAVLGCQATDGSLCHQ